MEFGEKLKKLRRSKRMSQAELAKLIGVSQRTIAYYEAGKTYPRYKEIYEALAATFDTTVDFFRSESEEFMEEVWQQYGTRGQRQAAKILGMAGELFAGGELSEEDKMALLTEMQQLYLDSKQRARKFTPKRYLKDTE